MKSHQTNLISHWLILCTFIILSAAAFVGSASAKEALIYQDIIWAKPKGFALTADIKVPEQQSSELLPVVVIFHGGGWLVNRKEIMNDLAAFIPEQTQMITVNVNYRLLGDLNNTTTMNEIIEDAMGAVLWVKDNIKNYGGDPNKIAVTGDSAGGHLAAMVVLAGRTLATDGFSDKTLGFNPTYLPKGKTAEEIAKSDGLKVQAAILSYAALDLYQVAQGGFFESDNNGFWHWAKAKPRGIFGDPISVKTNPEYYRAVSPSHNVKLNADYTLPPQFVFVGSLDQITPATSAEKYVNLLKESGQKVEYKLYQGKGHGFLDSGCNEYTKGCFDELAKPVVKDMITFLNKVFATE
ncbi:alpha/beta hydrolase [Catenovulum sp. 2E275]|uniref:alpha/beta hydrolase n=1 Tax=Catenovulum sp. 2E275 TaxID=2980497 RepID=UPI0021D21D8E|nr:alpha/beta hydrolase [Catenovulum sp. 2E275]MCU4676798.1 alpha/beta hydrolase [Catenovulum sp. 2E275]